jgi:hypothetical protein
MIDSKKDRLGKGIEMLEKAKATTEEDLRLTVGGCTIEAIDRGK